MSELLFAINNMSINSIVLGLSVFSCVVSLFVLLRGHQKNHTLNKKLQRLEHDLRVANGSAIGMGQQLINLEKQLKHQHPIASVQYKEPSANDKEPSAYNEKPSAYNKTSAVHAKKLTENLYNNNNVEEQSVYNQARESLARGLDIADVAKQCGLSFAEVSLLKSLSKSTVGSH